MKTKQPEYKIFEGKTLQEALNKCFAEGYIPEKKEVIWKLRKEKKIPHEWYDTRDIFINGVWRLATLKELKNLKEFYNKGGSVLFLGLSNNNNFYGGNYLNLNGRFLGVRKEKRRRRNDLRI